MKTVYTAAACITPMARIENAMVIVEDGVISSVGAQDEMEIPAGCEVVDLGDSVLAPGLIDMHIHGGAGHDVMEGDPEAIAAIERHLAAHGTTAYFPTTVSAGVDATLKALEQLADAVEEGEDRAAFEGLYRGELRAQPLGIHMEGPFLSKVKPGVHPLEHLKEASLPLFDRMWEAARGRVKIMTIAPEIEGAEELIRELTRRGVTVSLGHSNATLEEARRGIAAGGRHATHTFNAMRALDHREPGIVGAVLTDEAMSAEMIVDGVHVEPSVVRLFLKAKGAERAVLVTDGLSAAGMGDGVYQLGDFTVEVKGDVCMHEGRLAGSVLTLDHAVRNVMRFAGWKLDDALRLATLNPSRTTGMCDRKGVIAPGASADFVVLTHEGVVQRAIVAGRG